MNLYILDTDTLQLFEDKHPHVVAHVQMIAPENLAVSVISVEEQLSGWYTQLRQAKRPDRLAWAYRHLAATVRFLSRVQIIDFDEAAIRRFDQVKKRKIKIGTNDLRIAATDLEQDAILVTRNLRDFRKVPGLRIDDWSK